MKLLKTAGATSEIWQVFIQDSSSSTGAGLTGLAFNTASLTAYYHRDTDTTATVINLVTMTVGTFTSSGFKEIDATNMAGWYQFCPPNAAIAAGSKSCAFHLKGATNMAPLPIECQLTAVNVDSATAFMTSVATAVNLTNAPTAGDFTATMKTSLVTAGNSVTLDSANFTAAAENAFADALLDRASAIETAITPRLALRYISAACAGVLSGAATTTTTILGVNVGTTRMVATVDASGNRSAISLS